MWDDLDIQQKSELMRLFIKNNIYSLDKMKEIYNDTTERQYSSGGQIHIEPSKRGTFKAQASRMGMTVQEAASHILANKGNYSPAMVKKANFARNFAHADGGNLFFTGGPFATDPPTQLTYTPKYQPVYSTDYSKPIVAFNPSDNTRVVQQPKITPKQYQAYKNKPFIQPNNFIESKPKTKQVVVEEGDTLWNIAKENNISLNDIVSYNPQIKNINKIQIGDKINLNTEEEQKQWVDIDELYSKEDAYDNMQAILSVKHNRPFAVVDKSKGMLYVYNTTGQIIDRMKISTGASGNDYNTFTYTQDGKLINHAGNNSTPAGISKFGYSGKYHGSPSKTRLVYNPFKDKWEETPSSIHLGKTNEIYTSNGCIRMSDADLRKIDKYFREGDMIYTLPSQPGSRFKVSDGQLIFEADNPYGKSDSYEDDYVINKNKDYNPIRIKYNDNYNKTKDAYVQAIVDNKEQLQKDFGVSSKEYNKIAQLALGIPQQESEWGTGIKQNVLRRRLLPFENSTLADLYHATIKRNTSASKGITSIKYDDDILNADYKRRYKKYGITKASIRKSGEGAAKATMIRLLSMYKDELANDKKKFYDRDNNEINPYDALLYLWQGQKGMMNTEKQMKEGRKAKAYPSGRSYIKNIKRYSDNFKIETYL